MGGSKAKRLRRRNRKNGSNYSRRQAIAQDALDQKQQQLGSVLQCWPEENDKAMLKSTFAVPPSLADVFAVDQKRALLAVSSNARPFYIKIVDIRRRVVRWQFPMISMIPSCKVASMCFNSSGKMLIIGCSGHTTQSSSILIVDLPDDNDRKIDRHAKPKQVSNVLARLDGHRRVDRAIAHLAFDEKRQMLYSGTEYGREVYQWDLNQLHFPPSGDDSKLQPTTVWDAEHDVGDHTGLWLVSMALHQGAGVLVSYFSDRVFRVWSLDTGTLVRQFIHRNEGLYFRRLSLGYISRKILNGWFTKEELDRTGPHLCAISTRHTGSSTVIDMCDVEQINSGPNTTDTDETDDDTVPFKRMQWCAWCRGLSRHSDWVDWSQHNHHSDTVLLALASGRIGKYDLVTNKLTHFPRADRVLPHSNQSVPIHFVQTLPHIGTVVAVHSNGAVVFWRTQPRTASITVLLQLLLGFGIDKTEYENQYHVSRDPICDRQIIRIVSSFL
jgi:hypothetical protein